MKSAGPASMVVAAAVCAIFLGGAIYSGWRKSHQSQQNDSADSRQPGVSEDPAHFKSLAVQQNVLISRIIQKQDVARALIYGKLTFTQAADRFRELSADDPTALVQLSRRFPAATDAELWYREVIGFVRGFKHEESPRAAALVPKLEAEVARRFPPRAAPRIQPQSESVKPSKVIPRGGSGQQHAGPRISSRAR